MATRTGLSTCPLCDRASEHMGRSPTGRDATVVRCVRCGKFEITDHVIFSGIESAQKSWLSAYCRRLPESAEPPLLTMTSIEQFIRAVPRYTPPEKLLSLLATMARMSPGLGKYTTFDPSTDYPLVVAESPSEIEFLLGELRERRFIEGTMDGVSLTLRGWERLQAANREGALSNRVFVAMWFDKCMDELYDNAIEPAIRQARYDPLRLDRVEHVNRIDDEIISQIKRSRFMVADFTGQRYGVYFEAGMMMGLGRTVIWLCDKKELDEGKIHFDVRQFNFIAYESQEDARARLYMRILAVEGEGPGEFEKPG